MFVSGKHSCNVKSNGNGTDSARLLRLGQPLPPGLGYEMVWLLHAGFVSALAMPDSFLQHPPKSAQALAGPQLEEFSSCFRLHPPAMREPSHLPKCPSGEAGLVWMADGSGDLDFPLGGQLFTASRVNDLIILWRLSQQPQKIESSVHCGRPELHRDYSITSDDAPATSGDNEFSSPDRPALWFLREISPGTEQHSIAVTLRFRGELDVQALDNAIGALLSRRGIFYASPEPNGETAFEQTNGTMAVFVEEQDVGDIDDARLAEQLECSINDPLDLACGLPLQACLYHRFSGETVILLVTHRSVADFWSITAFICELEGLYSELTGRSPGRPPELAAFTRYYSWVDGSRVSTHAILDPDESSDVSVVP